MPRKMNVLQDVWGQKYYFILIYHKNVSVQL
jgi:hypothetical protein